MIFSLLNICDSDFNLEDGTLYSASSGLIVANGKLFGFPSVDLVIAWKKVDLPTFARPTIPIYCSVRLFLLSSREVCGNLTH